MLNWSFSMIIRFMNNPSLFACAICVASLNMLIQILFSMAFGEKSVIRLGGKR